MRKRKEVESSGLRTDILILEVLLDIRDMIIKQVKPPKKKTKKE